MHHPHHLVTALVRRGLLAPEDVVDGTVRILEISRRHRTVQVLTERGTGVIVKLPPGGGSAEPRPGTVSYEGTVHRALAELGIGAALEAAIPPPLSAGEGRRETGSLPARALPPGSLLTTVVPGVITVRKAHHREGISALSGYAMGRVLGLLHSAGRDVVALADRHLPPATALARGKPETFDLLQPRWETLHGTSAAMHQLVITLQQTPSLREPLQALADDWRTETVIHGDPRWDNWLVRPGGQPPPGAGGDQQSVLLIDWEFAQLGDPRWDLGVLLGDYLGAWVLGTPELPGSVLGEAAALSRFPLPELTRATAAVWRGYLDQVDLADPDSEMVRITAFAAARLVQLAAEQAHRASRLGATTAALLQLAGNMLADPHRAAGELLGLFAEPNPASPTGPPVGPPADSSATPGTAPSSTLARSA